MKQKIIFFITIFIVFYGSIAFAQDSASLNPNFNHSFASDMESGQVPANEWTTIKGKWLHQPKITVFFKDGLVSYNQDDMYWFNHYLEVDLPSSNIKVVSSNGGLKKYAIKPDVKIVAGDLEHNDYAANLNPPAKKDKKVWGDVKFSRYWGGKAVYVEGNPMYITVRLEDWANYGGHGELWISKPTGGWKRLYRFPEREGHTHHHRWRTFNVKRYRNFWLRLAVWFGSHHTDRVWMKLHEYSVNFDVIKIYDNFSINYVAIDQQ